MHPGIGEGLRCLRALLGQGCLCIEHADKDCGRGVMCMKSKPNGVLDCYFLILSGLMALKT